MGGNGGTNGGAGPSGTNSSAIEKEKGGTVLTDRK